MKASVGKNIRSLRKACGETQEELGRVINVEKNTVSYYESGQREPGREILAAIARHYGISAEELATEDFSALGKLGADYKLFYRKLDLIFPLFVSEKAMSDPHFDRAYALHRKIFDEVKRMNLSRFDELEVCIDEYVLAFENEGAEYESMANCMGIFCLLLSLFEAPPKIEHTSALWRLYVKEHPGAEKVLEDYFETGKIGFEIEKKFDCKVAAEGLAEMIAYAKQTAQWSQLADYYLAFCFILGLRENGLSIEFNRRIGLEMMAAFAETGNGYAGRYLRMGAESSQIVDDKKAQM